MKRMLILLGSCACLIAPAAALTDDECKAQWTAADANKDGVLSDAEAGRYLSAMRAAGKTVPADGKVTDAMFMENCKAGAFATANADAGAPVPGANSFTEAQAKDRVTATGLKDVSALKKDADGIWRGTASDGSKSVEVAVDFKGNVTRK